MRWKTVIKKCAIYQEGKYIIPHDRLKLGSRAVARLDLHKDLCFDVCLTTIFYYCFHGWRLFFSRQPSFVLFTDFLSFSFLFATYFFTIMFSQRLLRYKLYFSFHSGGEIDNMLPCEFFFKGFTVIFIIRV